ncbi:FAD/FMN-containing dehydrogenase [Amycolatopsis jiangsuensis]|uniref:FAD/FMN-containing dehydrogenase n=1 Tax=Amycolatopsis jiangsuensis TaxID=1181879 RepID=A0A840IW05_9PSEU|nr:FAD/FMN-containing dehydrogenase [Amycolatopsis jiangsuensis]
MFLGSEGILGVITEAWMRLRTRPSFRGGATVTFADYAEGVAATRALAQSGLSPSNCRLLDPAEAFLNAGVPTSGGVLLLGFESADHPVDAALARALELCADHGGVPSKRSDGTPGGGTKPGRTDTAADWRSSFLRMPYQRDVLAARSMIVETFDTAYT